MSDPGAEFGAHDEQLGAEGCRRTRRDVRPDHR